MGESTNQRSQSQDGVEGCGTQDVRKLRKRPETKVTEESQIAVTRGKGWPRPSREQETWQRGQGTTQAKISEESGSRYFTVRSFSPPAG